MNKIYPKIEIEDVGDEDAHLWFAKASRGGKFGLGSDRDSLRAREKAIQSLENKEK